MRCWFFSLKGIKCITIQYPTLVNSDKDYNINIVSPNLFNSKLKRWEMADLIHLQLAEYSSFSFNNCFLFKKNTLINILTIKLELNHMVQTVHWNTPSVHVFKDQHVEYNCFCWTFEVLNPFVLRPCVVILYKYFCSFVFPLCNLSITDYADVDDFNFSVMAN